AVPRAVSPGRDCPGYLRTDSASLSSEGVSSATSPLRCMSGGTASGRVFRCRFLFHQLIRPALRHAAVLPNLHLRLPLLFETLECHELLRSQLGSHEPGPPDHQLWRRSPWLAK